MSLVASSSSLKVEVKLGSRLHQLLLPSDATRSQLFSAVSEASEIPASNLKILYKGKAIANDDARLDLATGAKLMALGSAPETIKAGEDVLEARRRCEAIIAERPHATVRKTHRGVGTLGTLDTARFHQLHPFPEGPSTPFLERRREMLQKLAADKAIMEIMKRQDFRVGELTELHPHRDPTLLGLNRNGGESIALRLLTDSLDGLRSFNSIRRVLIHELTHNKWGPHDLNFKQLDSQLTKEVAAFDLAARSGGNRLGGDIGEIFDPESRREAEAMATGDGCTVESGTMQPGHSGQRLGGQSLDRSTPRNAADARSKAAEAAEQRLQQQ